MVSPIVLAAAVAVLATGPAGTAPALVQAVKTVCKANLSDPVPGPAICRGGGGRLSRPTVCFCPGGRVKVESPACWQDGRPAMHRPDRDFTRREYDSFAICSDVKRTDSR